MLSFRELTLQDRALVQRYAGISRISYFQFSNMYMWRAPMHYRICEQDGILYLIDQYRDLPLRAFPPFCPTERLGEAIAKLRETLPELEEIRPITSEGAARLSALFPGGEAAPLREQWDYLYRTEDLISLAGRKYHTKKNHLNLFRATYRYEYHDISPDSSEDAFRLLFRAAERLYHPGEDQDLDEEYVANMDLMQHFREFSLRAAVLTVEGTPIAYSVGEQITPDTALIHIEKADRAYRGAYAAINQMFVSHAWQHLTLINREEDMGIEGLRRAKESYQPAAMNEVSVFRLPK